ncbi:MAG: cellulose binding domain-containing protein, partial [Clostridiales bacterium]
MKKKTIFLSITVLIMIAVITLFVINISAASKASFTYDVVSDWRSGAVVNLTITNEGSSDIDGWKAKMDFDGDQEVETIWSGSYTQEGKSVILENSKWNSKIASGESVTLGFTIKYSGTNSKPSNIELVSENEVPVKETVDEEASENTDEQSNESSVPDTLSSENDLSKELLAFPGAEGYGKNTVGGRGGDVYEVTTLNPTGAGSLGEAIGAKGARTVIFRVAGTITGNFQIRNDNITIAGQTAPGDGICIKGKLSVDANNVIVRYIRVRPNAVDDSIGGSHGKENVILDHVSASWSADEVLSIYRDTNLTIQYSMITEACS